MKRSLVKMIALATGVAVMAALGGCGDTPKQQYLNIGTGGTAGTYYPLGGAISEIINKNIPGANASTESTGASVANINMLKDHAIDMAFVQNDIAYYAANGIEMFAGKKVDSLRGIATLYPETIQLVTLEKNGIHTIADLRGKRVAVGAPGSGAEANARQILQAAGLTYDDIDVQYLSFGEASGALKDGNVDAAFVTAGFPTAAVQDVSANQAITLVALDDATADALVAQYPYYTKTIIPAGTYDGVTSDVATVSVMAMIVTTDKMTEQQGYDITKAIFSNLDRIAQAHAVGKLITKEGALQGMPLTMNAGAKKALSE